MFENDYLMHHGIKGQKWGVRRYQNTDGSWTAAGRARYSKGGGSRAKYGSQLNSYDKMRVAHLNEQIDELNGNYQRSHAGRKAVLDSKPLKDRKVAGAVLGTYGAAIGTGLGVAAADAFAKTPKGQALLTAAGGLVGGLGAAKLGSHLVQKSYNKNVKQAKDEPFSNNVRMELNRLIQERNRLDPSQKNRKGRVITKEEYSDYYNTARNDIEGSNKHKDLVSDQIYNDYLKNTTTYGSKKKAKYGARLNAYDRNRVAMLNEQIDELNEDYQRSHAGRKAALASKPKAEARAEAKRLAYPGALAGLGIGGALATYTSSPGKAALATGLGTAIGGLGAAKLGSHLAKKNYKKKVKQFKDEPFSNNVRMELNELIQERNHLDPSQKNRKGRVITKEEYSDYYNTARNELEGGNKHKGLVSDQMYNDYLKNTTTYGSKKNATYGSKKYYSEADILKDFKNNYDDIDDPEERELVKDLLDSYGYSGKKKRR